MPHRQRLSSRRKLTRTAPISRIGNPGRSKVLLQRLEVMQTITRAISEQRDLANICAAALLQLSADAAIDAWAAALFRDDRFEIVACGLDGGDGIAKTEAGNDNAIIDGGPLDKLRSTRRAVALVDATDVSGEFAPLIGNAVLHSIVLVPLQTDYSLFGFLMIARKDPDAISPEEVELFEHLGIQIGTAVHQRALSADLHNAYEELHTMQQRVMRQERLDTMSQIASTIVHDVNNALSPIVVYADLLLRNPDSLSERARKYIVTM